MTSTILDPKSGTRTLNGVAIGLVMDFDPEGRPLVVFADNSDETAIPARATVPLTRDDIGCEVALMFEAGDAERPIVMGRMLRPARPVSDRAEVELDGKPEDLDLTARKKIVLRCGKASITLTAEGKVLIKGAYVSSRSTGQNRIKGGSVHLN